MKIYVITLLLTLFSSPLIAATNTPLSYQGKPFVGIQLGDGQTELGKSKSAVTTSSSTSSKSENGLAMKIYGGYLFPITKKIDLGLELGIAKYADSSIVTAVDDDVTDITKSGYKNYHIDLLADINYHLNKAWLLLSKVGLSSIKQKMSIVDDESTIKGSKSKVLPKIEVGAGYQIMPNGLLSLSYTTTFSGKSRAIDIKSRAKISSEANRIVNYQAIMLGFNYSF